VEEEMRMNFFFGPAFWGTLLILWGASLILKTMGINLPFVRIFIAVIIILFGIRILIGNSSKPYSHSGKSNGNYYRANRNGEYNLVFSGGTIDLSDISAESGNLEITVVFGNATVILPSHLEFDIEPTSVFGVTVLPDRSQYGFGIGKSGTGYSNERKIHIESNAVFGRIEYIVEQVDNPAPADSSFSNINPEQ
jgi:predicted membrane protein